MFFDQEFTRPDRGSSGEGAARFEGFEFGFGSLATSFGLGFFIAAFLFGFGFARAETSAEPATGWIEAETPDEAPGSMAWRGAEHEPEWWEWSPVDTGTPTDSATRLTTGPTWRCTGTTLVRWNAPGGWNPPA